MQKGAVCCERSIATLGLQAFVSQERVTFISTSSPHQVRFRQMRYQLPAGCYIVSDRWLERCISMRQALDIAGFRPCASGLDHANLTPSADIAGFRPSASGLDHENLTPSAKRQRTTAVDLARTAVGWHLAFPVDEQMNTEPSTSGLVGCVPK